MRAGIERAAERMFLLVLWAFPCLHGRRVRLSRPGMVGEDALAGWACWG